MLITQSHVYYEYVIINYNVGYSITAINITAFTPPISPKKITKEIASKDTSKTNTERINTTVKPDKSGIEKKLPKDKSSALEKKYSQDKSRKE